MPHIKFVLLKASSIPLKASGESPYDLRICDDGKVVELENVLSVTFFGETRNDWNDRDANGLFTVAD